MKANYVDVTSLLVGARNNETVSLQQLAKKFGDARFFVPLVSTRNVRNSPESVAELGPNLPAHYLSLADGRKGAVLFTNRSSIKLAEKELSWKTDNGRLRCLSVPGNVVANHAEALFDDGAIDRVILNPGGPHETHLSQGDLATLEKGQPPSRLSFHAGEIPVPSFMPPSMVGSLADVAISKADSFFKHVTKHLETLSSQSTQSSISSQSSWTAPLTTPIVIGGDNEKLDAVVGQLFAVFSKVPPDDSLPGLSVNVNKVGDDIQITVNRPVPDGVLQEAQQAVKQTLTGAGSFQLSLDLSASQGLAGFGAPAWTPPPSTETVSKKSTAPKKSKPKPAARRERSKTKHEPRRLDYIPLDPEPSDKSGD